MEIKAVRIGDEGQLASRDLHARFAAFRKAGEGAFPAASLQAIDNALGTLDALDRQYGGEGPLPLEGADEVVAAALTERSSAAFDLDDNDLSLLLAPMDDVSAARLDGAARGPRHV